MTRHVACVTLPLNQANGLSVRPGTLLSTEPSIKYISMSDLLVLCGPLIHLFVFFIQFFNQAGGLSARPGTPPNSSSFLSICLCQNMFFAFVLLNNVHAWSTFVLTPNSIFHTFLCDVNRSLIDRILVCTLNGYVPPPHCTTG